MTRHENDPADRNALEIVFSAVLAVAVAPVALGLAPLPASLDDAPTLFGRISAVVLCLGCVCSLVGIMMRNRDLGLVTQQAGLLGMSFGSLFYGAALIVAGTSYGQVSIAVGMSFGIGLGAIARLKQVQDDISDRVKEGHKDVE